MANLDLAFGNHFSSAEKQRILRTSFQTFAQVILDIFWFTRHSRQRLADLVAFDQEGLEQFERTPLVCITGHFGNWEILGQALSGAGYPLHSVAAPLANPGVDTLFIPSRELSGQTIVPKKGAIQSLIQVLRNGGRVALLLDQNTKPNDGGVFVNFFGTPVPMSASPALLALRTRSNLLTTFCSPQPDGSYRIYVTSFLPYEKMCQFPPDPAADLITSHIARTLEEEIRQSPGNWLWMYKRWKHFPPGAEPGEYPWYSRPLHPDQHAKTRLIDNDSPMIPPAY